MKNANISIKVLTIALIAIMTTNCSEPRKESFEDLELTTVDITDMEMLPELTEIDIINLKSLTEVPIFQREKCKRRFPVNKFNFTIKGEGINIPVKNGAALNIGKVELGTEVGTAITETVLIIDGYNEQLCQTRNVVGQVALTCGQNYEFYKIITLQTTANNALLTFFLALKAVQSENDVKKELESLKSKLKEIDKRLAEV